MSTATTIPVTIEDDLARLTIRTNTVHIADALEKLNNTITANAKVLATLCDDVATVRATFDMAQTRNQRRMTQIEEAHEALLNDVQQNIAIAVRTLQNKCAWKAEVADEFRTVSGRVKHCESFIEEIETGGGDRVQKFVRSYVESYVPKWYETIAGPLWVRVTGAIARAADETTRKCNASLLASEDKHSGQVVKLRKDHDECMAQLDVKHVDALSDLAASTTDQFKAATTALHRTAAEIRSEAGDALSAAHERFSQLEIAAHALRATLCVSAEKCEALMNTALCRVIGGDSQGPQAATPQPVPLAAAPSLALMPLASESQRRKSTSADAKLGSKPSNPAQPLRPQKPRGKATDAPPSGAASDRGASGATSPAAEDIVVAESRMAADLAAFRPVTCPGTVEALAPTIDDLPLARIMSEPRAVYLLRSPAFVALRTAVQDEMEARVAAMRDELQHDLAAHLLEVQTELKTKVNVRRLAEFLQENRDETLYTNVRTLLADVQELRMHKVDTTHFHEVLRQKADLKGLDLKADKQAVSVNVAMLTARVDTVEHEGAKHHQKLAEADMRLSELVYWLHTGRSMGDPASRMVSTHQHSELLKLRPTKHGLVDRHSELPQSVVVESRRELPPGLEGHRPTDAEHALVPTSAGVDETIEQRPGTPNDRRSPKRRAAPTPPLITPGSGRHPHHPQKKVFDGAAQDHLAHRGSSSQGSRPGRPMPIADYMQLAASHDAKEPGRFTSTAKTDRVIPDGPLPRDAYGNAEPVSWIADEQQQLRWAT
jgi:hypothetical protein